MHKQLCIETSGYNQSMTKYDVYTVWSGASLSFEAWGVGDHAHCCGYSIITMPLHRADALLLVYIARYVQS